MMNKELSSFYKRLTKYELSKLIGMRAKMIENGADLFIEHPANIEEMDALSIAWEEYRQGRLPLQLKRKFPNGEHIILPVHSPS